MEERTFRILESAIRDFIATGEPVSSGDLFERHDFGIRPAMIRAELSHLTDEGYLEQPYHSSGRVPSNRGYEFFASRVLDATRSRQVRSSLAESFFGGDINDFLAEFTEELGIAAAAGTRDAIHKEGLEPLMEHLAWESRDEVLQVIRDFEALEDRLARMKRDFADRHGLNVYIGRKSPVTRSNELAVMAADYDVGGERMTLFAIGPKRMDYEKAVAIFKHLQDMCN